MHAWWLPSVHSWWNFNLSSNRFLTYFSFPCFRMKQKPLWFHLSLISVGILAPVGHKKYTAVRGMCLFCRMKPIFGSPLKFGGLVFFFFFFFCWWNYNHWNLNSLFTWSWHIKVSWCLLGWLVGVPGSSLPCCFQVGKVMESSEWQPVLCHSSCELKMKSGICVWVCCHHI